MNFKKFFFINIFLLVILCSCVFAQFPQLPSPQWTQQQQQIAAATRGWIDKVTFWFFREHVSGLNLVVYIVSFIILAILFVDAFIKFSPLSRRAAIAVGLLLAFLTSFMGGIGSFARFMLAIAGGAGAFGAGIAIGIMLLAYFLINWIFKIFAKFSHKGIKSQMTKAAEGAEGLIEFAKRIGGKRP